MAETRDRIVVVGSLNADLVVTMRRFPLPGETVAGQKFNTFPGGKGANQAYGAARLGASVCMVGQIGADAQGAWLKENLASAGVDVSHLLKDDGASSGVALISIDETGQNEIVIVPGANGTFTVEGLERQKAVFARASLVLLQLEIPLATVTRAALLAKEHGATVLLDPAPAQTLPDSLLSSVDYLTPNESELIALTEEHRGQPGDEKSRARKLLGRGAKNVIVKMGERGALLISAEREEFWPAFQVTAVDTTAAGDCFNAALAVALTEGQPIDEAVALANAAAAISVTRHGAQPSMPTRAEVEDLLKNIKR